MFTDAYILQTNFFVSNRYIQHNIELQLIGFNFVWEIFS